ncbi:polysaccharide biosynthesis tyrosine autokinase [Demequina rhizosphaerae]|uniref:polysaccharide biosynthesis tyrosine autokinase n=1 Tax=Demequina rhizosphaerae TaxID=1638985 RepID=UPI0009E61576|nr:polysaccharide biosynthesis tyrosine autokinase [Demequina rhizosphaerae]
MDLPEFIRMLRKHWLVIAILTMLGTGAGLAYAMVATPSYTATANVFVSTTGAQDVTDLATGNTFTQQRVKTYTGLVKTVFVLEPVIDELELGVTVPGLRAQVSASAPANTTAIDVTATDPDPETAAALATATARSLIDTVESIETTDPQEGSPVRLTLVQPAEVPLYPASPKKSLDLALGLLVGLALGVAYAVLRSSLDTRIRGERDLKKITTSPVLGGIVVDPKARQRPLIVHEDAMSPRAECFRTLRTNLQFLEAERVERSFVITSSVPSEGKSTTAANLAITLADAGAKVLLVDADLRKPKMAKYMGIESSVGLTDVLIGRIEFEDAVQQWGAGDLYLLPSGSIPPNPSELLGSSLMGTLIEMLDAEYDIVLYDAPPLLPVTDAAVLAKLVGGTLLIVSAGTTHRHQLETAITSLETVGAPLSGIVLTRVPTKGPDAYGYGSYGYSYGDPTTPETRGKRRGSRRTRDTHEAEAEDDAAEAPDAEAGEARASGSDEPDAPPADGTPAPETEPEPDLEAEVEPAPDPEPAPEAEVDRDPAPEAETESRAAARARAGGRDA